jgi:hypothetical protein
MSRGLRQLHCDCLPLRAVQSRWVVPVYSMPGGLVRLDACVVEPILHWPMLARLCMRRRVHQPHGVSVSRWDVQSVWCVVVHGLQRGAVRYDIWPGHSGVHGAMSGGYVRVDSRADVPGVLRELQCGVRVSRRQHERHGSLVWAREVLHESRRSVLAVSSGRVRKHHWPNLGVVLGPVHSGVRVRRRVHQRHGVSVSRWDVQPVWCGVVHKLQRGTVRGNLWSDNVVLYRAVPCRAVWCCALYDVAVLLRDLQPGLRLPTR